MTSGEEIPFLSRPPSTADLVIVGGGVVGIATAFFAARAGLDTLVLEKRPALGTLSTSAATGAFRLQFDNADELNVRAIARSRNESTGVIVSQADNGEMHRGLCVVSE